MTIAMRNGQMYTLTIDVHTHTVSYDYEKCTILLSYVYCVCGEVSVYEGVEPVGVAFFAFFLSPSSLCFSILLI